MTSGMSFVSSIFDEISSSNCAGVSHGLAADRPDILGAYQRYLHRLREGVGQGELGPATF